MSKSSKSSYTIKMVFLYINEKSKLNIAKYNKNIQKNIDISIINYKLFTGKYIIYESKGFGKEYYSLDNRLIYEGENLNGERNGKGKEYNDKYIIFEGEYLNGERNGKGKEYYINGNLQFEGEYLNWKRTGKGKEYYRDGKLKFEGEYLNDRELIGKKFFEEDKILNIDIGKEYNENGKLIFEGEYLNGKKNGKGKEYDEFRGLIFEGEYLNGLKWNGKGYEYNIIIYELINGKGIVKE